MTTYVSLDYLIPDLRLKIGDSSTTAPRYIDDWLERSLILAVKNLQRYWKSKYLVYTDNTVYRNPDPHASDRFQFEESQGVIESRDEPIIVLMAAIIVLEGSLENSAWDAVSWRDNEISFSNLEVYRSKDNVLKRMVDELNSLILPPTKRLAGTRKMSLPGYLNNDFEKGSDF